MQRDEFVKVEITNKTNNSHNYDQVVHQQKLTASHLAENQNELLSKNTNVQSILVLNCIQTWALIVVSALGPVILTSVCLFGFEQITLCMILYQVFLISIPGIFIFKNRSILSVNYFIGPYMLNLQKQILIGLFLLLISFGGLFFGFILIYDIQRDLIADTRVDLKQTILNYIAICFFLGIVNPILEEFYWRCFIQKICQDSNLFGKLSNNEEQRSEQKKLFNRQEIMKIMISLCFGFYHMVVISYFSSALKGFLGMLCIQVAGRVFVFLKEKVGIWTAILAHMGADWAVLVIMFLIIYYVQKDKDIPIF